jgi:hypothetical protein
MSWHTPSSNSVHPVRSGRIARWRSASPRRRALLAEAAFELALAAAAIHWRTFRGTLALGARPLGPEGEATPDDLANAVARAASAVPFRAVCFQQGLALQRMARRRGFDARLHYGVAMDIPAELLRADGETGLHAHVWVTLTGRGLIGHEQAAHFRELLCSPA